MATSAASTMACRAREIAANTQTHPDPSQVSSQTIHRLEILKHWFGSLEAAQECLHGRRVLEVGCGQGDMTAVLAHLVAQPSSTSTGGTGKVLGLDPAPLTYGSPLTLGECHEALSKSSLGHVIEWIQADPTDYLTSGEATQSEFELDYIVFVHSFFYLESESYLIKLLDTIASWIKDQARSRPPKLPIAEWSMRASVPMAEAHVLAVQAQAAQNAPLSRSNVRTLITPERLRELLREGRWIVVQEDFVCGPNIADAAWEVDAARRLYSQKDLNPAARSYLDRMQQLLEEHHGKVTCMDAWTCVCSAKE